MKNIVILGSTGSIGKSTLSLVDDHPDKFNVIGLTANGSVEAMSAQIRKYRPQVATMFDRNAAAALRKLTDIDVLEGPEGVEAVAAMDGADFVVSAIVGAAGLAPTLKAVERGRAIGLANKESLVVAGYVVMERARKSGAQILPVDSEHSAVFQCMRGNDKSFVSRIILTASGGPFNGMTREQMKGITPEQALKHPSWSMGRKITIDSATLMNKGLEVIEAHHLFGARKIDVVIHPQSIIHSMVEFSDSSTIAQMSVPDMRGAIAYALSHPARLDNVLPPLDLAKIGKLEFRAPDLVNFPCLQYAYDALKEGGTMPAVVNAANEVAVDGFLSGTVGFNAIADIIKRTMDMHKLSDASSLEAVLDAQSWAFSTARGFAGKA